MDRAFASGSSASAPTAPASPSIGYATAGNPGSGTPPTKPGPWWYHMVTEELRGIIAAAGLTPSQSDITQLLQALPGALASRPEMARSLAVSGYQNLPGGLIFQWKQQVLTTSNAAYSYPISFPTGLLAIFPGNANSNTTIPVASNNSASQFNAFANSAGSYYIFAIGY